MNQIFINIRIILFAIFLNSFTVISLEMYFFKKDRSRSFWNSNAMSFRSCNLYFKASVLVSRGQYLSGTIKFFLGNSLFPLRYCLPPPFIFVTWLYSSRSSSFIPSWSRPSKYIATPDLEPGSLLLLLVNFLSTGSRLQIVFVTLESSWEIKNRLALELCSILTWPTNNTSLNRIYFSSGILNRRIICIKKLFIWTISVKIMWLVILILLCFFQ